LIRRLIMRWMLISLLMAAVWTVAAAPAAAVRLFAGERELANLPQPIFRAAKMMVPVEVAEYLGSSPVSRREGEARFTVDNRSVTVTAGSSSARIDDKTVALEEEAFQAEGTIYVPVRLFCEVLRVCDLSFEQQSGIIRLLPLTGKAGASELVPVSPPQLPIPVPATATITPQAIVPAPAAAQPAAAAPAVAAAPAAAVETAAGQQTAMAAVEVRRKAIVPRLLPPKVDKVRPTDVDPAMTVAASSISGEVIAGEAVTGAAISSEAISVAAMAGDVMRPDLAGNTTGSTTRDVAGDTAGGIIIDETFPERGVIRQRWEGEHGVYLVADAYDSAGSFVLELPGFPPEMINATFLAETKQIALDIAGFSIGEDWTPWPADHPLVSYIRLTAHQGVTRMLLELTQVSGYTLEAAGEGSRLYVHKTLSAYHFEEAAAGGLLSLALPADAPYEIKRLREPDRLVIDLPYTTLTAGAGTIEVTDGPLYTVRVSQFNAKVTRVVLDLKEGYAVEPFLLPGAEMQFLLHGEVQRIGMAHISPGSYSVFVTGEGRLRGQLMRLSQPDRLVLDISPARAGQLFAAEETDSGPIRRIEAGQYTPDTFRLTMELSGEVDYRLVELPEGGGLAVLFTPLSINGTRICIDAGHGGTDPGAIGRSIGLLEKDVNLDIALHLGEILSGAGAKVFLTRSSDITLDLHTRPYMMSGFDPDLMVSIHSNATGSAHNRASGTETWYASELHNSRQLAEAIQDELVKILGTADRGVKKDTSFAVLRYMSVPSVLVEVAFISHEEDEKHLADPYFRQKAAQGIYNGMVRFLRELKGQVVHLADPREVWDKLAIAAEKLYLPIVEAAAQEIPVAAVQAGAFAISRAGPISQ